jgi:hypothetical protein
MLPAGSGNPATASGSGREGGEPAVPGGLEGHARPANTATTSAAYEAGCAVAPSSSPFSSVSWAVAGCGTHRARAQGQAVLNAAGDQHGPPQSLPSGGGGRGRVRWRVSAARLAAGAQDTGWQATPPVLTVSVGHQVNSDLRTLPPLVTASCAATTVFARRSYAVPQPRPTAAAAAATCHAYHPVVTLPPILLAAALSTAPRSRGPQCSATPPPQLLKPPQCSKDASALLHRRSVRPAASHLEATGARQARKRWQRAAAIALLSSRQQARQDRRRGRGPHEHV